MGLDQYLEAKKSLYPKYTGNGNKDTKEMVQIRKLFPEMYKCGNIDYIRISFQVGYWRKANQIHKWFVDNCQDGKDDCGSYWVSRDKLEELLRIVNKVLDSTKLKEGKVTNGYTYENGKEKANIVDGKVMVDTSVAQEYLPCQEGFFFGETEYDEWYYRDLVETKKILKKALSDKEGDYYYSSSW